MSFTQVIFYFFIALAVVPAFLILFTRNVMYAAFSLLLTFLGVAGIYVFAQADFLAVTQIMIYAGGVLVLILFGVMLTNRLAGEGYITSKNHNILGGTVAGIVFFVALFLGIVKTNYTTFVWMTSGQEGGGVKTTIGTIGENLMTRFVLPFETAAILLLAALMGAAYIASQIIKK